MSSSPVKKLLNIGEINFSRFRFRLEQVTIKFYSTFDAFYCHRIGRNQCLNHFQQQEIN